MKIRTVLLASAFACGVALLPAMSGPARAAGGKCHLDPITSDMICDDEKKQAVPDQNSALPTATGDKTKEQDRKNEKPLDSKPVTGLTDVETAEQQIKELEKQIKSLHDSLDFLQRTMENNIVGTPNEVASIQKQIADAMTAKQQDGTLATFLGGLLSSIGGTQGSQMDFLNALMGSGGLNIANMSSDPRINPASTNSVSVAGEDDPGGRTQDTGAHPQDMGTIPLNSNGNICIKSAAGSYNGPISGFTVEQQRKIFECHNGEQPNGVDPKLLALLSTIEQDLKKCHPDQDICINLVSGYRSPGYNAKASFTGTSGPHTHKESNIAADILVPGISTNEVRNTAWCMQAGGVGDYPNAGTVGIHVDTGKIRAWYGEQKSTWNNFTCSPNQCIGGNVGKQQ